MQFMIEATTIKVVNSKPVAQRVQFCFRVVDVFGVLDEMQQPLRDMKDGEALAQCQESLRATTLFGWRSSPASRTARIALRRVEGHDLLKPDLVPPKGVEIVLAEEALARAEAEISEANQLGIVAKGDAAGVGNAIVFAVDDEAVEVGVGPIEGSLEEVVELGDRGITADKEVTPDERADPAKAAAELVDVGEGGSDYTTPRDTQAADRGAVPGPKRQEQALRANYTGSE
jgi:hypothetical protein